MQLRNLRIALLQFLDRNEDSVGQGALLLLDLFSSPNVQKRQRLPLFEARLRLVQGDAGKRLFQGNRTDTCLLAKRRNIALIAGRKELLEVVEHHGVLDSAGFADEGFDLLPDRDGMTA